jgi:hypothetical protein
MNPGVCTLDVVAAAGPRWRKEKQGFGDVTADSIAGSAEISTGSGKVQIGEVEAPPPGWR